jgi:predicted nucleotidyltransferase
MNKVIAMKTIQENLLTPKEKQAIQEACLILNKKFPIAKIILFGSKARGNADSESDIDLLILTDGKMNCNERYKITDELFEVNLKYDVCISAVVLSQDEWDNGLYTVLPIHQEILEDGILV